MKLPIITGFLVGLLGVPLADCLGMGRAPAGAQPVAAAPAQIQAPRPRAQLSDRDKVLAVARADIGVIEKTGQNDGARVETYLRNTGLGKGHPYCAAAVVTWHLEALGALPKTMPRSALAAAMVRNPTWKQGKGLDPRPGDTFGLWIKKGVHHTGLVVKNFPDRVQTIEANTSPTAIQGTQADRDAAQGGGVFSKVRFKRLVYSFQSHLP